MTNVENFTRKEIFRRKKPLGSHVLGLWKSIYLKNYGCVGSSGNVGKVIFQGGRVDAGGKAWTLLLPNTPLTALPGDLAFLWGGAGL